MASGPHFSCSFNAPEAGGYDPDLLRAAFCCKTDKGALLRGEPHSCLSYIIVLVIVFVEPFVMIRVLLVGVEVGGLGLVEALAFTVI